MEWLWDSMPMDVWPCQQIRARRVADQMRFVSAIGEVQRQSTIRRVHAAADAEIAGHDQAGS